MSVGLSVTLVSRAKMAAPIEMGVRRFRHMTVSVHTLLVHVLSIQPVSVHWMSISVQSLSVHTKYRYNQLRYINVNLGTSIFNWKTWVKLKVEAMLIEVDSTDRSGVLISNSAFRGWFHISRCSNIRNVHCDGAGVQLPFKRPQLHKPGRQRWRVCWRWFAIWSACGDRCLMSWTRTFNCT